MQKISAAVQTFRGNHYDYGIEQGKWLLETHYMDNRNYEWIKRRPKFSLDFEETKALYMHFAPHIWDEIMGLKESLRITDRDVLLNLAHYRVSPRDSGCSVYIDDDVFIRNYDYHPNTYDGMYKLFKPDQGYAHIGPASRVTGRMDGMNEHGLVMAYNFMNRKQPADGFTCFIIGRFILELCRTAEEARHLLMDLPHRGGFSYIIQDKEDHSFLAETSARGLAFRDTHICTNHYESLADENRRYLVDSKERLDILENLDRPSRAELLELFTDRRHGLFVDNYRSWAGTIHTSVYDRHRLTAGIKLGENGPLHEFDFKNWMDGQPVDYDIFHGYLDTELKFTSADWQRKTKI
ncbi:acyl-CoA--6-aminopenicillanic acid acyltransferase [Salinicoccus sp. ID82-1]|uniref:Acyl-CoA--6-aminopenicillanic acid acyltransferase n=1 Tax=Salinicoccus cyprini TaxID=2493691 RepID=A0A558AZL7_9STAP|nr:MULTISPECIES: C45 family autoproteolytic acyltransferase/hydolase [Salinicoccus]MCG1009355.1 acyl-CoA--6-aminopenicillanic acid acyltransferase [Salinicoccus sp. ID82-1]TVT29728.1 acyl-CoA--6-aminopenicillanic acid acyltransferase [Salinicoccus cyprini]